MAGQDQAGAAGTTAEFEAMVEAAPIGMVMVDQQGSILRVNRAAETLFGYSREEFIGQAVENLVPERFRTQHPTFRAGFFTDPRPRVMGAGRDLFGLRKDGTEVPIEIGLSPVDTAQGVAAIASVIDISERKAAEERLRKQQEDILELSTPVIQVWDKVLALPLIGTLDSLRAARLTEALLTRIAEDQAEVVIVDISGVPVIDTAVAQHLLKTVQAARLMGASCVLSGVRPETAQTMVHLGIDLQGLESRTTLRDALQLALRQIASSSTTLSTHFGTTGTS